MSLSKTTLSSIQQAGQALHKATMVVSSAVRAQAEHMVATVASQPFQAEGEQAFNNFKMLARLSQDLLSLEEQLKALYATASELASPLMDVVATLPHSAARGHSADDTAEDVVVKPASTRRATSVAKNASKRMPSQAAKSITLTVNDNKVLQYMQSMLKPDQAIALTGAAIGKGAGLPLGSVGVSVKKVLASGAIKKSGRGTYLLAVAQA